MKKTVFSLLTAALLALTATGLYAAGGKDDIEGYKIPQNLRQALAEQFTDNKLDKVPKTYGDFLHLLHEQGAEFYVNSSFLVVAKIEEQLGSVENLSAQFFKPIGLKEMLRLRTSADYYE